MIYILYINTIEVVYENFQNHINREMKHRVCIIRTTTRYILYRLVEFHEKRPGD